MPDLLSPAFLARLEQLELVSRRIFRGRTKGERLGRRKGQSVEFADFRPYAEGDDLRRLDWNILARLDKLFLRIFLEEEDLHVAILLDGSASMEYGEPTKFRYAKQVAAALGFVGLVNMDRVQFGVIGRRALSPAFRGRRSMPAMVKYLDGLEPGGSADFNKGLRDFAAGSKGSGVVMVLSDFLDKGGYEAGLRALVARQFDAYAVQILAAEEIDPPMRGDLKLTDIEDGDTAEVTINGPLLERYQQTLAAFRGRLQEFCTKRGVNCLLTSNGVPFEKLVLEYFRRRGLVR